ncbi:MAG: DEAD/DEAH box helicase [Treponema sp.]|nr:DEAD/DEAH box helicase [Treponema sp.]
MQFSEFNLHPDLQRGIAGAEYINCMPVQEQVLTHAFGGQDLYVQSQTGTGKTAAFLVVIFQRLLAEDLLAGKKALIMAPTRELAVQIEEEAKMLARYLPFKVGSFYGGVGYTQQEKLLRENVQIMVGTPGRVLDLNKSGRMNLMDIAFLVLDEADRMFDMGFYPDLRKLIRVVPPADRRQTMLFSATLNAWVKNLAWEYTREPFEIEIKPEIVTVEEVDQILYHVPSEEKMRLLLGVLEREKPDSAIVFCNTKRYTEICAKRLRANGYDCEFIIGDLPQNRRLKVIDDVKAGKAKLLVATDVAARGLDIEGLSMVVNYDLPVEAENYVHRIGRTARAGKTGRAITLASEQDVYELPAIERYIGKKIPSEIAVADLYAEDKSAGQHIRSELYEDRREERHLHGNAKAGEGRGARPHGQNRGGGDRSGGKKRDAAHGGRKGDAQRQGRRQDQRQDRKPDQRSGHPQGQRQDQRQGQRQGQRPEQRSAMPGSGTRGNAQGALGALGVQDVQSVLGQHNPQDLNRMTFDERMALYKDKYNSGPGGKSGSKPAGGKPSGKKRGGKPGAAGAKGAGQRGTPPVTKQPAEQAAAPAAAPAKKGVISRLLGLFGKK